jgi:hypothetical protein
MLLHYWSLAIEEQVYLLLPIVLFVCLRRSRQMAIGVLTTLAVVSFSLPVMLGMSLGRTYYGTDTRAGEILVGAILALAHAGIDQRRPQDDRRRSVTSWVALVALAGIIALALVVRPTSEAIRTGLLPAVGVLSVVVLHGCRRDPHFAWGLFERRPVVWVGRLSYPIYLLHWPVLVVLGDAGWSPGGTAVLGALITVALAWPLDRWVERPLRLGGARQARKLAGGGAVVALVSLTLMIPEPSESPAFLDRLEDQNDDLLEQLTDDTVAPAPSTSASLPPSTGPASDGTTSTTIAQPPPRPTVGVFGDSLGLSVALILANQVDPDLVALTAVSTTLGCGQLLGT